MQSKRKIQTKNKNIGTVLGGAGIPVAAMTCNAAQGVCMASCAATFIINHL